MGKTDIVVCWVDDKDKEWRSQKKKYKLAEEGITDTSGVTDDSDYRYRDWDLLKFWFRGIEKYAPWVNKVFFVTCGQKPEWLNTEHPKLRMVNHEDYIPHEWLPTFSSRTIFYNVHRIPDLSEQHVLFDDDTFIVNTTSESDFFVDGRPCDSMVFNPINATSQDIISSNIFNNVSVINKHFSKSDFSKAERRKMWYTPKYGKLVIKNRMLSRWGFYLGFQDFHFPVSILKETYKKVWAAENELVSETCSHRFRKSTDVTPWLMRYWQMAEKNFEPRSVKIGRYFEMSDDNGTILDAIRKQSPKLLCINEGKVTDFEKEKSRIHEAFLSIFPDKSGFEL